MNYHEILLKQVDEKVQQLLGAVCSNKITSFEEYKYLCGEIQGLYVARGYILDLKDQMEQYDDDN